jgi:nitrite reductase (cytochrome c-552)
MTGRRLILVIAIAAAVTVGLVALLVNIFERRQEARDPFFRVVEIDDYTDDPAVWGKNFPLQYDTYRRTVDQVRTRYGGSEAMRRQPTDVDPRSTVAQSKLEDDRRLVTMWAGYPFATDFREERGHAYMLIDQRLTRRVLEFKQPGACLNCHASTYVTMLKLGNGDIFAGFEKMNPMPYAEATKMVNHPVSCIDCHDPQTMGLRITRPAFIEGIRAYKASQGVQNYDWRQASAQEMRTFVCAQCHVEYYFQGAERRLVYPWAKGLTVEAALDYYDEIGFHDWIHAETGARSLKAQHPEFEMFMQGTHGRAGVACADCHMPYMRVGGTKVSDHQVRSPLLMINRSCQTCHGGTEAEIKDRAETIQSRFIHSRDIAMNAVVDLIHDIRDARKAGRSDAELEAARNYQRRSGFMVDYVEAENSMGFHSSTEAMRILTNATDLARKGQLALRGVDTKRWPDDAAKPVPPRRQQNSAP